MWILPTVVTDRFGNTVRYTYDVTDKWKLLNIQGSDGRKLSLTYHSGTRQVATVSDGTRTWRYHYGAVASGRVILQNVGLPDGSFWILSGLDGSPSNPNGLIRMNAAASSDDPIPLCDVRKGPMEGPTSTGSIVHPSGAVGSFTMTVTPRGRNGVPHLCYDDQTGWSAAYFPIYFDGYALTEKTIKGPGIPDMSWKTSYDTFHPGWLEWPTGSEPNVVSVTDPKGDVTRHSFGSTFRVNEGQLLRTDIGWNGSTALRTTTVRNNTSFTQPLGTSDQDRGDGILNTHLMPEDLRIVTQQGVTFTWQVAANADFDHFARPKKVTRSSSLGSSRTVTTAYSDNLAKWILGQTASITESSTGALMVENTYDPSTANLLSTRKFGVLGRTFTYNPDGTLATSKDGKQQTTTYSNYKRGLAQNIAYPDTSSESALVDNLGLITSHTNPSGYTTGYGYDAMGRLSSITYPAGDSVAWNPTTLLLERVIDSEYGLDPGHWRQTISTGNARTVTYLDALWRPVLTRTYDVADEEATRKMVLRQYDDHGHPVYESYPQRTIGQIGDRPPGSSTDYDALGRVTESRADSELGVLNTSTDYLDGFQKKVIPPRGHATTTSYQVFDEPVETAPVKIVAPENLTVDIERDVFGKARAVSRSGSGMRATRSYVYDAQQRLCKTIEPETGATMQDYDAANNTAWRAAGLNLPALACERSSVAAAAKTVFGYDTLNRLTSTTFGDASPAITRTYTPDGLPRTVLSNGALWTMNYNRRRLSTSQVLTFGGQNYTLGWAYNANGHMSQLNYPSAAEGNPIGTKSVAYAPNGLGEPTQVGNFASGIHYHPGGAIAGFTYGNGVVHTMTPNTRNLPELASDVGIMRDEYRYDANGNVASITDRQENIGSRTLGYDALDRLSSAAAPGVWGQAVYAYDVLDNIRSSTVGGRVSSYAYDTRNRLAGITSSGTGYTFGYAYDAQGNIVKRGAQAYTFDQGNRMTGATGMHNYVYDGLGHRVRGTAADGTVTVSVYSPDGQLLYTTRRGGPNPAASTQYIYLHKHQIAEVKR